MVLAKFGILALSLVCLLLAWLLHNAWCELEEAYKALDDAEAEAIELDRIASVERQKAKQIEALWSAGQLGK